MTDVQKTIFEAAVARKFRERQVAFPLSGFAFSYDFSASLREDAWRLEASEKGVTIEAGGVAGLYAAAGAWMRRSRFDGEGGFQPFVGELALSPENPIHGIYFASHFHNYYEDAPREELEHYLEDLAFQGSNVLMAWYDMHHYESVDQPASQRMIAHLRHLYGYASLVGMKTVFGTLSNEAFASSPEEMRAEWQVQNGYTSRPTGHYHVELCPNKEGGMEEILRERREVMKAFEGTPIDYISIWPYDQGGCTCEKCAPWGANGYLDTFKALSALYAEILPEARLLCSTWYFDRFVSGEWQAFADRVNQGGFENISYLFGYFANEEPIPDFIRKGDMPGGKKMIAFPEISMHGAHPWGGFGANPMPERMEKNFRRNGSLYAGALPYSEGIYEDINKALMLAFYSGASDSADDVLREYAFFEYCLAPDAAEDFVTLCHLLESTLGRKTAYDAGGFVIDKAPVHLKYTDRRYIIRDPEKIEEAAALACSIDSRMPLSMRKTLRWRIVKLRTEIDLELLKKDMYLSEKQKDYAAELVTLYHGAEAWSSVTPLTEEGLQRVVVQ